MHDDEYDYDYDFDMSEEEYESEELDTEEANAALRKMINENRQLRQQLNSTVTEFQSWVREVKRKEMERNCVVDEHGEEHWPTEDELWEDEGYAGGGHYFAEPGGRSSLTAATMSNPRILPCPTCLEPNALTPADRQRGYCCDRCALRNEGWGD